MRLEKSHRDLPRDEDMMMQEHFQEYEVNPAEWTNPVPGSEWSELACRAPAVRIPLPASLRVPEVVITQASSQSFFTIFA